MTRQVVRLVLICSLSCMVLPHLWGKKEKCPGGEACEYKPLKCLFGHGKCCKDQHGKKGKKECTYKCFGRTDVCANSGLCVGPDKCDCPKGGFDERCEDINECATIGSRCAHICVNVFGSYKCSCKSGYVLDNDKHGCVDVNECLKSNGGCQQICANEAGGHRCECEAGYLLSADERTCIDVDECLSGASGCQHNCTNTKGSYMCSCQPGYVLNPDKHGCTASCFGLPHAGKCLHDNNCTEPDQCACRDGFAEPQCEDIDECKEGDGVEGPCHHKCENLIPSFNCSCDQGYRLLEDGRNCEPICEEREFGVCPYGGVCVLPGVCNCTDGFSPPHCEDIDECASKYTCDHMCFNEIGSFRCGCESGYSLLPDKRTCEDVLECQVDNGGCSDVCVNSPGFYHCTCHHGYELLEDGKTCKPRCHVNWALGECPNNGSCVEPGVCQCLLGYQRPNCKNIDECASLNGGCSHTCTDTIGSFICSCPPGYTIEGKTCMDIDECSGPNDCSDICVNVEGSFDCQCSSGRALTDDKTKCSDIDECSLGTSGCEQTCQNTDGSFKCACQAGYVLEADGTGCIKFRLCESNGDTDCLSKCESLPNKACECPDGFTKVPGKDMCTDPCWNNPCLHGGRCQIRKGRVSFVCDCSGTGFSGKHCERGRVIIPRSVTVSKRVVQEGVMVSVWADGETVIWAKSEADVTTYPNPVRVQSPNRQANFSILSRQAGNFDIVFNVSNPKIAKKSYSMSVRSNDVFRRLDLTNKAVPEGCFYATITVGARSHTFTSTRPWFRKTLGSMTIYTLGLTHYRYNKTAIPLRIDGLQVTYGTRILLSPLTPSLTKEASLRHTDPRDKGCTEIILTSVDMDDFRASRSLVRTLFHSFKPYVPYWCRFIPLPRPTNTADADFYSVTISTGKEMRRNKLCGGVMTEEDVPYLAVIFTGGYYADLLGQTFTVYDSSVDKAYCMVIDFKYTNTLGFVLNSDTSHILQNIPFAAEVLDKYGTKVYPRQIAMSKGWDIPHLTNKLEFYNGATMFNYRFPDNVRIHARMSATKEMPNGNGHSTALDMESNFYVDRDPEYLFSHLNVEPLDVLLGFKHLRLSFRLNIFGKVVLLRIANALHENRAVLGSGGDGVRKVCGLNSNPPGIFAQAKFQISSLPVIGILTRLVFTAAAETYYFLTFSDRRDQMSGWKKNVLDNLCAVQEKRANGLLKYLNVITRGKTQPWKSRDVEFIRETLTTLTRTSEGFNTTNVTSLYFGDFSRNCSKLVSEVVESIDRMESNAENHGDQVFLKKVKTLKRHLSLLQGATKNIWWVVFDGSQPYYPDQRIWGITVSVTVTVLGRGFIIEGVYVISPENLMKCSSLYEYYDHVKGGNVTLVRGKITLIRVGAEERFGAVESLWRFFTAKIGAAFELALSSQEEMFTARIEVFCSLFGIRLSINLFLTNYEIVAMFEANVWNIFRARLRLGGEIPRNVKDIALWVKGDFLPGGDDSFEGSFWEALIRVVRTAKDTMQRRLREGKQRMNSAQDKLIDIQENIRKARANLDSKQTLFDNAVERLEAAKATLEKAKKPFLDADQNLKEAQRKVNRICTIKTCTGCRKKVQRSSCSTKGRNTCVKTKSCGFSIRKLFCMAKNVLCRIARGLAYAALAVARAAVAIPLIALDAAKAALSLAQIVVDKSRMLLHVAKGLYTVADAAMSVGKSVLSLATKGVDMLIAASSLVFKMFEAVVRNTLQKLLDIKQCGFKIELSVRSWLEISVHCELNILSSGWKKYSFTLNFKDVLGSMFGIAQSSLKAADEQSGSRRGRRSVVSNNMHTAFFSQTNASSADHSTVLDTWTWPTRCERHRAVVEFLNTSAFVLKNVSREIIEDAQAVEQELTMEEDENIPLGNLTLEIASIDAQAAEEEFGLSRVQLEQAIAEADLGSDESLLNQAEMAKIARDHNQAQLESLRNVRVTDEWSLRMEDVDYFGDCLNFPDCVTWSFGEIRSLMDSIEPRLVSGISQRLDLLELRIKELLDNETSVVNHTANLELDLSVLAQLSDIFCATAPVMLKRPVNTTAFLGENVTLGCLAESPTSPVYYWFRGDILIGAAENFTTLRLSNVTEADSGVYACVAGNHIDNTTREDFHIHVVQPPLILSDLPPNITLFQGEEFHITANVSGIPTPSVTWAVCSATYCQAFRTGQLRDFLRNHTGGEQLVKYKAENPFGEVESKESIISVAQVRSACPSRVAHWAFTATEASPETRATSVSTNRTQNQTNLGLMFKTAFEQLLEIRRVSVKLQNLKFDVEEQAASTLITIDCVNNNWTAEDRGSGLNVYLDRFRKAMESFEDVLAEGHEVFQLNQTTYNFNPVYFRLNALQLDCPEGFQARGVYHCAKEAAPFVLVPPSSLKWVLSDDVITLTWDAPFYAQYFDTRYIVAISSHMGGTSDRYFNTSSSSLTVTSSVCGVTCTLKVQALTSSQHSDWTLVETIPETAVSHHFNRTALVWGLVLSLVVAVFLLLALLGSYWKKTKSAKVNSMLSSRNATPVFSIHKSGSQEKANRAGRRTNKSPEQTTSNTRGKTKSLQAWVDHKMTGVTLGFCGERHDVVTPTSVTPSPVPFGEVFGDHPTNANALGVYDDRRGVATPTAILPNSVIFEEPGSHSDSLSAYNVTRCEATRTAVLPSDIPLHEVCGNYATHADTLGAYDVRPCVATPTPALPNTLTDPDDQALYKQP